MQRAILLPLSNSRTASKRDIERATMILHLENHSNSATAATLGCNFLTAKHWRQKWLAFQPRFDKIEGGEAPDKPAQLRTAVFEFLADAPRPGAPPTYSAEQYCQIMAVCLEAPEDSGRAITHWTHRELTDEVHKRGIADISESHLGFFLKRKRPETPPIWLLAQPTLYAG